MNKTSNFGDPTFDFLLQSLVADDRGTLPAVIWRADLVKNEINFLNEHSIPGLEEGAVHLLQNAAGAEQFLAADDRPVLVRFQERLQQRLPVSEVVRARGRDGVMRWLFILGTPDPEMTFCYIGLLADCTSLANAILKRGSQAGLAEHVELFSNPVFMVHVGSRQVVAANEAARNRLGINPSQQAIDFGDILVGNSDAYLRDIYERLLFDLSWNGLLEIKAAQRDALTCFARVRAYDRDGRHLLWFSLTPRSASREQQSSHVPALCKDGQRKFAAAKSVKDLLAAALDHQPEDGRADAALLSQIFIPGGHVVVSGVGAAFKDLYKYNSYPYQGSIAENIVLYNLDHLIVEDTSKSIKPIDWALFIPHGIRSYFAVPYFHDNVLRDVLIFCSTLPNAFDEETIQPYLVLAENLWTHLPRIVGDPANQRVPG